MNWAINLIKEMKISTFTFFVVVFFAFLSMLILPYSTVPWIDEVGTSDAAISILQRGEFHSHVWPYSYNPLHLFTLIGWLSIVGVSHFTVCLFNIVLHVFASLYLVKVLRKREIVKDRLTILLLLSLLWGGYAFLNIILNGRIDILTLFTTLFLVDCLTRKTCNVLLLCLSAFLSFGSAVYQLPPLIIGLGVLFLFPFSYLTRREIFKRGVFVGFSFGLAYVVILAFYYSNQSLLRFVNTYISFSATVSGKARAWGEEIGSAYMLEKEAIVLLGIVLLSYFFIKRFRQWIHLPTLCFVGVIPVVMVLAGRYVFYYSWIFYIPVIILFAFVYSRIEVKKIRLYLPILSFSFALFVCVFYVVRAREAVSQFHNIEAFANSLDYSFTGRNVVFTNNAFYYFIVNRNAIPWSRSDYVDISPKEKYESFVRKVVKDKKMKEWLMNIFDKIQYVDPTFPEEGFLLTATNQEFDTIESQLKKEGYFVTQLSSDGEFKLSSFSRLKDSTN